MDFLDISKYIFYNIMKELPIYRLNINNDDSKTGVFAAGLVENPAIQVNWTMFSENENKYDFQINKNYEQVLTGPFLIPNQLIYRQDDIKGEYYVTMDEETIKLCSQKFMKNGFVTNTTHQHKLALDSNYIFESWIVTDTTSDKSNVLGYNLPVGTWMISIKIEDTQYWESEIVNGNVKGFSIEGIFDETLIQNNFKMVYPMKKNKVKKMTKLDEFMNWIKSGKKYFEGEAPVEMQSIDYVTEDGQTISFDPAMGIMVVDVDGNIIGSIQFVPIEIPAVQSPESTGEPVTVEQMPTQGFQKEVEGLKAELTVQLNAVNELVVKLSKEIESIKNAKVEAVTFKKENDNVSKVETKVGFADLLEMAKRK